jgi:hypothetical protein
LFIGSKSDKDSANSRAFQKEKRGKLAGKHAGLQRRRIQPDVKAERR